MYSYNKWISKQSKASRVWEGISNRVVISNLRLWVQISSSHLDLWIQILHTNIIFLKLVGAIWSSSKTMGAIAPTAPNLTITLSKISLGIPQYQQHLPQKPHKYGFRSSAVERYQVSSHNVKTVALSAWVPRFLETHRFWIVGMGNPHILSKN